MMMIARGAILTVQMMMMSYGYLNKSCFLSEKSSEKMIEMDLQKLRSGVLLGHRRPSKLYAYLRFSINFSFNFNLVENVYPCFERFFWLHFANLQMPRMFPL